MTPSGVIFFLLILIKKKEVFHIFCGKPLFVLMALDPCAKFALVAVAIREGVSLK
jgi:hypothetical protein